jgi:hypothetical protein
MNISRSTFVLPFIAWLPLIASAAPPCDTRLRTG